MRALYVVATPIGNLEDITLRAVNVLREVSLIAAEDTRRTKQLLSAYGIKTSLTSYHEHNKQVKLPHLLRALEVDDVALVSNAGVPGINDPGYELIQAAVEHDISVVPIPGPSAITTSLSISGIAAEQFIHLGFLPRKKTERKGFLESVASEPHTIVAFETPHRLLDSLEDMSEVLGERRIAVCRELTKLHEEVFRGTASEAMKYLLQPRGEFTIVIEGRRKKKRNLP